VAKAPSKKSSSGARAARSGKAPAKAGAGKTSQKAAPKRSVKPVVPVKIKSRPGGNNGNRSAAAGRAPAGQLVRPELPSSPVAPVASNEKPRKNQAGFSSRELEHFRDLLLAKRREILGDMSSMEREALRSSGGSNLSTLPIHMADMGTDNYEQEFTLGLVETERKLLREINLALAKIQNGTFGVCEGTGKPITKARLEVQPWARYSIEYAKQMEIRAGGTR
jgi:RNA polymerase-binding protein DksA